MRRGIILCSFTYTDRKVGKPHKRTYAYGHIRKSGMSIDRLPIFKKNIIIDIDTPSNLPSNLEDLEGFPCSSVTQGQSLQLLMPSIQRLLIEPLPVLAARKCQEDGPPFFHDSRQQPRDSTPERPLMGEWFLLQKLSKILVFTVFCDQSGLKTVILEQKIEFTVHLQRLSHAVINHWHLQTLVTGFNFSCEACKELQTIST